MAVVAPAPTVTDTGTVSAVLVSEIVTAVPPEGAACDSVTVQVEVPPEVIPVGLHCSPVTVGRTVTELEFTAVAMSV